MVVSAGVSLRLGDAVAVGVGNSRGRVGGSWVGVERGRAVSFRASIMPPTTRMIEKIAMMTPIPSWPSATSSSKTLRTTSGSCASTARR